MALDDRGPRGDRRFMVVDEEGRFVSQREEPRLCLVGTGVDGASLTLSAGGSEVRVPRAPSAGEELEVEIWSSRVRAIQPSVEASAFFSEHLGRELRFVYMPDASRRPIAPPRGRPGDLVSFSDAYPLLMISEESLAGLNERLEVPLPMDRFRPNIVVAGGAPHAEDDLEVFRIGEVSFRNVKPCDRCSVTTVDPETGERGKEPLRALAEYRKWDGQVWFGTNLIHDGRGTLSLGDPITPL